MRPLDEFSKNQVWCNSCKKKSSRKRNEDTRPNAHNNGEKWTSRDDELLIANQHLSNKELAKLLGRTLLATSRRKDLLGIHKEDPPEKETITEFRWYVDSSITLVTLVIEGCQLTVYSNLEAPIQEAFIRDGLSKELYEQWVKEKIRL